MNTTARTVDTRFAPETRFDVIPGAAVPFKGTQQSDFDRLKDRLLTRWLNQAENATLYAPLRRAANDAAALAWLTPFPALFFPELFEEKVREARLRVARQRNVRARSRFLKEAA